MNRAHPNALRALRSVRVSRGRSRPGATGAPRASRSGQRLLAAQRFWQLPDRELDRLLALASEVDRIELKFVVPASAHESTCATLGVDFSRARAHRVCYLDTPDRALHRNGVVARLRSRAGRADDAVVKLRPVDPTDLPSRLRRSKDLVVEVDGMPGHYVCSAALRARLGADDVGRVMLQRRAPYRLFTRAQTRLLVARLPAGTALDDLVMFGPVDARRVKMHPEGLGRRMLVERWTYPDGSRLLELSTRCAPAEALQVSARTADVLRELGVDLTGPQQTKTRATLDFFAGDHLGARSADWSR